MKIFSPKQKTDKKCLEIAKIISNEDTKLISELKESYTNPKTYIDKYYERLSGDYFLDDDEIEEFVSDKWMLMADILELHGYICERDWKDELEDFLFFLFQTKRAISENIKISATDPVFSQEGDIPQWSALIDEKLAEKKFVVGHIDTDSDAYRMFLCTAEELETLKNCALAIGHKIDFAKDS